MKNLLPFVAIALMAVFVTSCRKDKKEEFDLTVDSDNSRAENLFSDLFKVVDQASINESGIRENIIGCIDTIIVDSTSNPRSILIDFGDDNCVSDDGRIRKGRIFVTYTGRYRDEGTVIIVTPQNYTVNGYLLQGTKVITNLGLNSQGKVHFSIQVNGSVTAAGSSQTAYWQSNRTRTWVAGSNTITPWDDVYEITGSGSGTSQNGTPFTVNITSPLRAEIGCPWLVSGIFQVTPQDGFVRTFNLGNGECNSGFSVNVNGQTFQFGNGE